MRSVAIVVTWVGVAAIAVLSLLPADDLVRTGFGDRLEHVVAYAGLGLAAGLAFRGRRSPLGLFASLAALAAILETLQALSAGRHPSVGDFLASSTGAVVGIAAAGASDLIRTRFRYLSERLRQPD